ncbi:MAG: class I SAM-dependent methyltransferase [Pseudomonadota bacterium]
MTTDRQTLELYSARAADYADRVTEPEPSARLRAFIDALPRGGRVLDLGCGPGNAAAAMARAGLDTDALDAAAGMVDVARRQFGVQVRLGTFEDVDITREYHGIWANFSLLHAPRADMPGHLCRLHDALAPHGLLHIGLKTGSGARRDGLGRLYTYFTRPEIKDLLTQAGLTVELEETGSETGFDGVEAPWVVLWARRL